MAQADSSDEEDVIFITPESTPKPDQPDQGESPHLRRSSRKRTAPPVAMTKHSASKKKKTNSPGKKEDMEQEDPSLCSSKTPRTPAGATGGQPPTKPTVEALLLAMESRLIAGIDTIGSSVEANSEAITTLKEEIVKKETAAAKEREDNKSRISDLEERLDRQRSELLDTVSRAVRDELKTTNLSRTLGADEQLSGTFGSPHTQRFWECRRSLRIWPVPGPNRKASLGLFFRNKLKIDDEDTLEDLANVLVQEARANKGRNTDEVVVIFPSKEVRDSVKVTAAIERCFPLITTRRRSSDPPWINAAIRKRIKKRKAVYRDEGRSPRWKRLRKVISDMIKRRMDGFHDYQKNHFFGEDAKRHFFRNVKALSSPDKPAVFDVRTLFPGKSDEAISQELATYFNAISGEFTPLEPKDIPRTFDRSEPTLELHEVSSRIRKFRKPRSMVGNDIFPKLLTLFSDFLAIPLTDIYNQITVSKVWPVSWKTEYVTVIPKCAHPTGLTNLRNISCTELPSKIYESFLLQWVGEEVKLRANQFGGVKGCGTPHMLVSVWDDVLRTLEDYRAGAVLSSIDYAKAFNRLSYQHCLQAFARKGASNMTVRLIATFLSNRRMTVRVGSAWSEPRPVAGGVPQGSILGVMLFNVTTDDLEKDFEKTQCHLGPDPAATPKKSQPDDLREDPNIARTTTQTQSGSVLTSTPMRSGNPDPPVFLSPVGIGTNFSNDG